MSSHPPKTASAAPPRTRDLVALLAAFMALNAFALDTMLPALPAIGEELGVGEENRRQLVIIAYTFGFGSSQMLWGPLADRYGRKPILFTGVAIYCVFALMGALAQDFALLIFSRFMMGFAGSVSRVLITAITRDLFEGEEMARIMSLTYMVFMVVPVIAPSLGQLVLLFGDWRDIFFGLFAYGVLVLGWAFLRLPETLKPEYRRKVDAATITEGVLATLRDRISLGYTLALAAIFTVLLAYLASIQQIVGETFDSPASLGLVFAGIAAPMSIASWGNSKIVGLFGLRNVSHWGMIAFATAGVAHLVWHLTVGSTLVSFTAFMAMLLTAFAFTTANFGTLAMTNMAPIAGTASSTQGTIFTICAALAGMLIGQAYDGTATPFIAGVTGCGLIALVLILITERGRLFGRRPEPLPVAE